MEVDEVGRAGLDWRAGLRLSGSAELDRRSGWTIEPELQLDYVRRLTGIDTALDLRFLEAQSLGVRVPLAMHDGEHGELRGGVILTDGRLSIGAAVEQQLGQDFHHDDCGVVSVSYVF